MLNTHDMPTLAAWWRGAVPGVRLFVIRNRTGTVVARTTLHTDAAFDAKVGDRFQLFGATEFVDDPAVARALFAGIAAAARAAGRTATFGPVGLLPNESGGVITSGHTDRGFVDSPWNPVWYPAAYEAHGFRRRFVADTWICPDLARPDLDPDAVFAFDDARLDGERLVIHRGRPRQLPLLRALLNASFAQLGYYTPIDDAQLRRQTDGLAWLLDPSLLLYLTRTGRPVAFVVALPDVSAAIRAAHGDLGPLRQLRLVATRRRYRREAVLIVKGTVPDAQANGYMRLLSRELLRNLRAGGYTTLCALTFHDVFKAGASHFGVSDLAALAKDTHKFESRYLDGLIGPYPAAMDLYRARSPIHHVDRLSCPVIFFQGLEDAVVPPSQAEMMVEALRAKGLPVAYLTFAGEQHGFRQAATIEAVLRAELSFYGRIFGFTPADGMPDLVIENLA